MLMVYGEQDTIMSFIRSTMNYTWLKWQKQEDWGDWDNFLECKNWILGESF